MAGVPERGYQPQVAPGGTAPLPGASPDAYGAGVGAQLERAGGGLEQAHLEAVRLERERDAERQSTAAGLALSQLGADMDVADAKARETAPPGAAGHTVALLDAFDKRKAAVLQGIGDEKVRERTELQLGEMRDRLEAGGEEFEAGARVAQTVGDAAQMQDVAANRIRGAAAAGKGVPVLDEEMANLDRTAEGWRLPADKKEALVRAAHAAYAQSFIEGLPPPEAKSVLDSGKLAAFLKPERVEHLINRNETDLHQLEVEARQHLTEEKQDAETFLATISDRVNNGIPVPEEDFAKAGALFNRPELRLDAKLFDLGKAQVVDRVNRVYRNASPLTIDGRIKEIDVEMTRKGDKVNPNLVIERNRLAELLPARRSEARDDPLGAAARAGVALSPIDWSDPASLAARLTQAKVAQGRTGAPLAVLLPEEASALEQRMAAGGAAARIEVMTQLASAPAEFGLAAARQVAPGNMHFRVAVALAQLGAGGRAAARDSLLGSDALAAHRGIVNEDRARTVFGSLAPAMTGLGPEMQHGLYDAALGLYATRAVRAGLSEWPKREAGKAIDDSAERAQFQGAVNIALGAQRRPDGAWQGGIGAWAGHPTLLPSFATQAEFDAAIGRAGPNDLKRAAGGVGAVFANGKPPTLREFKALQLEAVGDGLYRVKLGAGYLVRDDGSGRAFEFDVRRLGHR
ncbi:MAG: hypothetical protein ACJ8DZ_01735 [Allosphingosinicella sp.]